LAEPQSATGRDGPPRPKRALVFSGGGARGAYEAGVIRFLVDELPKRLGHPISFDILSGTSVGAVHACFLAATAELDGSRGSRLVEFWKQMRLEDILPLSAGDLVRLVAIPGVGKKLAERMIVELKDKFTSLAPMTVDSAAKPAASSQKLQDAVSALINLGYKKPEIEKTVRDVLKNGDLSLEDVLRETLRQMGH